MYIREIIDIGVPVSVSAAVAHGRWRKRASASAEAEAVGRQGASRRGDRDRAGPGSWGRFLIGHIRRLGTRKRRVISVSVRRSPTGGITERICQSRNSELRISHKISVRRSHGRAPARSRAPVSTPTADGAAADVSDGRSMPER